MLLDAIDIENRKEKVIFHFGMMTLNWHSKFWKLRDNSDYAKPVVRNLGVVTPMGVPINFIRGRQ